jgi:hypothetical protein
MRNFKEEKLKRFLQGNLAHGQSLRSKGDDSKFLNGGRSHIFDKRKVNNLKLGAFYCTTTTATRDGIAVLFVRNYCTPCHFSYAEFGA